MTVKNNKVKICVSSAGKTLESEIDSRFGRSEYFLIVNVGNQEILDFKSIKNIGPAQGSGAGISAAEQIGELGVKVLITGDVGPKAAAVIKQLEIKVIKKSGVCRAAISEYINNPQIKNDADTPPLGEKIKQGGQTNGKPRIFIPLMDDRGEDSEISLHFGHAPYFGLFDASVGELTIKENKLDHGNPNKSPVDQVIEAVDPTVVFAQDMGARAVDLFTAKNIALKTGPYRSAREIIDNIDKLEDLVGSCGH